MIKYEYRFEYYHYNDGITANGIYKGSIPFDNVDDAKALYDDILENYELGREGNTGDWLN